MRSTLSGIDGRRFEIAQAKFQVLKFIFAGLLGAVFDHLFRVIDRDDFFGATRQQLAEQTFARAKIGDNDRREHAQEQLPERLPRAARTVIAIKSPRHLIEIKLRLLRAAHAECA